jgi:hypothetical protein
VAVVLDKMYLISPGQTQLVFEARGISGSSGRAPNQFYIYEHIVEDSFARYMSKII